jgi:hypothetical protein
LESIHVGKECVGEEKKFINKMEIKMTLQKILSIVLLLNGIIIFILATSADFIGFGEYPGYGYKQISGLILGVIAIIAGVYLKRKR